MFYMGSNLTEKVQVLLDKDTRTALKERAASDDRSESHVARTAIRVYLAKGSK